MILSRSTTQWHSLSWSQRRQKRLLDLGSPRISTWPLHLHGIAHTHTPGETLLPILSPSPHRTAPLIRDQLTLWNSFEQPPHLQHPCHFTWGLYMGMRILHRQHLPLVRSFWSVRQLFLHIEKTKVIEMSHRNLLCICIPTPDQ